MKKIVCLADLHIAAMDSDFLHTQLTKILYPFLKEVKPDLFVSLGDVSHHKIIMNSDDAVLYLDYGHKIKELSKNVLLVHGTLSHEVSNYKVYNNLFDQRFRFIKFAEHIFYDDLDILVLPEEYDCPAGYYDKFMNRKYDFIFGHGMQDFVSFVPKKVENIIQHKHAVTWKSEDLDKIVYGLCVFGHIHIGSEKGKVMYPGSFSRFNMGESEPKGFYFIEYDEVKKKVIKKEFIENTLAPIYKTITTDKELKKYENKSLDDLLKYLRYESENSYRLRIMINTIISDEFLNNLQAFVRNSGNTTIIKKLPKKLIVLTEKDKEKQEKMEMINSKLEKYKGLDFFSITKEIAKTEHGLDITTEELVEILDKTK